MSDLVAHITRLQRELDRVRAEARELAGAYQADIARLRAENEKLIQSSVALMQLLLRERMAHKATIRDYDEQLFQLRATALELEADKRRLIEDASERTYRICEHMEFHGGRADWEYGAASVATLVARDITAENGPQEGSNG